ncbi:DUF2955 domain-containing protein [Rhizobium sp. KVB221]|uniref:DUF2955 domain-containing protein n=1 Tax=Rhizobium setariae TaxID=2801340 RepID=A0A937CNF6_9HYPH|nr:DUF2955 domain-containing protein [Rhizobium setariae]MBL0375440.1 DUF2955 domain-containing protein [Rhizobium setariae]
MTKSASGEKIAGYAWNSDEGRKGLRAAFAAALGFTVAVAVGSILPFLGPLFAAQFLLSSNRPMPLATAIGMIVLIVGLGTSLEYLVAIAGQRPLVIMPLLGGLYFCCFYIQASGKGGTVALLALMVGVMVPLFGILNRDLGESILSLLLKGVITGLLLMWLAHALLPARAEKDVTPVPSPKSPRPVAHALANTTILLLVVLLCLTNDRFSTAMVIPLTVASLLMQLDVAASGKAATGLMLVNFLGGLAACIAFSFLEMRPTLPFLFLTVLTAGLTFGGHAARNIPAAKVFAGAFTIFLLILGIAISPIPGTAGETFSTRIFSIVLAILIVLTLAPILWPRHRPEAMAAEEDAEHPELSNS